MRVASLAYRSKIVHKGYLKRRDEDIEHNAFFVEETPSRAFCPQNYAAGLRRAGGFLVIAGAVFAFSSMPFSITTMNGSEV